MVLVFSIKSNSIAAFQQWVFISVSRCDYGDNVLLQYVVTANEAHNTETKATIALNIHIKIELMARGLKTGFRFLYIFIYFFNSYKLQL